MSDNLVDLFFTRQAAFTEKSALEWQGQTLCSFAGLRQVAGQVRCPGHRILERYGMTETVMITSNPYDHPRHRGPCPARA